VPCPRTQQVNLLTYLKRKGLVYFTLLLLVMTSHALEFRVRAAIEY